MSPWRAEVISHRRPRGLRILENQTEYAYFRTKKAAQEAAKERAQDRQVSYALGGDYHFEMSYRLRKDPSFKPERRLKAPKRRPPVARRDAQGRYRDRKGRFIQGGRKEALRRLRISRSLRRRATAIRRAKSKARVRYGVWVESVEVVDDSPPNFDSSWTAWEPHPMTFEGPEEIA